MRLALNHYSSFKLVILAGVFSAFASLAQSEATAEHYPFPTSDLQQTALKVLQTKCNVCHVRQNPRKVFTRENMDGFAPKIHRQVFIKKRMPRGRKIKLTNDEYQILLTWITSTKPQ
ncbi:MAG: hypothetical protein AAF992_17705 [Bacteroidota bacterium]